jgi:hypothetical protein
MATWIECLSTGRVLYDFKADGPFQINLKAGETVEIQKQSSGWYKGKATRAGQPDSKGIFPVSFIELINNKAAPSVSVAPQPPSSSPQPTAEQRNLAEQQKAASQGTGASAAKKWPPIGSPNSANSSHHVSVNGPLILPSPTASSPANNFNHSFPANNLANSAATAPKIPQPIAANFISPMSSPVSSPKSSPKQTNRALNSAAPSAQLSPIAKPLTINPSSPSNSANSLGSPKVGAAVAPAVNRQPSNGVVFSNSEGSVQIVNDNENKLRGDMSVEALLHEIGHTTHEWNKQISDSLKDSAQADYHRGMERLSSLLELRRRLIATEEQKSGDIKAKAAVRQEIIQLIESSRKMQEGYMVPRNSAGAVADTSNTPIIELVKLHRIMYSTLKEESSNLWIQKAQERQQASLTVSLKGLGPTSRELNLSAHSSSTKKEVKFPAGQLQLFLDVKMCIFSVGEATDLYFSLYNLAENKYITEDFSLSLTDAGMPAKMNLIGKMQTLFSDLEDRDFNGDLWLICKIYRKGRLILDPKEKKPPARYHRRPWGCAAMSLTYSGLAEQGILKEFQPQNSAMTIYTINNEVLFSKLPEFIIGKSKEIEPAPKAKGIALGLTLYPGKLDEVRTKYAEKLQIPECPVTRKLFFPDFMSADDKRNDFYIHLLAGNFVQDGKKSARNVEVVIRVQNSEGKGIDNCISRGSGDNSETEYHSAVYYHLNNPNYEETIRLNIPPEQLEKCHLLFTFWHISKTTKNSAPFAFGWLELTESTGAAIVDDEYKIPTFKPFAGIERPSQCSYLKNTKELFSRKDVLTIRTSVLSTIKTQNSILHSLFQWRSIDSPQLNKFLLQFTAINKSNLAELAKFVRETFDVLFQILLNHKDSVQENCYKAILHMLSLFTDKKLPQFKPLIDSYINELFADTTVHEILMKLTAKGFENSRNKPDHNLVKLSKSLNYVIKFILASKNNLAKKNSQDSGKEAQFKASLIQMLASVNSFLNINKENGINSASFDEKSGEAVSPANNQANDALLLTSQSYLVRNYMDCLRDLQNIFNPAELANILRELITSITSSTQNIDKLHLIRNLLAINNPGTNSAEQNNVSALHTEAARAILFPVFIQTIAFHLRSIDSNQLSEVYLCLAILMNMLQIVQAEQIAENISQNSQSNIESAKIYNFTALLQVLVHLINQLQLFQAGEIILKPASESILASCKVDVAVDSITCLFTILHALTDIQYSNFLNSFSPDKFLKFNFELFSVCKNILTAEIYPELWIVLQMFELALITRVLRQFSVILHSKYSTLDYLRLYNLFFSICFALLASEQLKLEGFSSRKKDFISTRYGDIRKELIELVKTMWNSVNSFKLELSSVCVPLFFHLAINTAGETHDFALDLYYDLLQHEYALHRAKLSSRAEYFNVTERHTIDALYNLANLNQEQGKNFMKLIHSSVTSRLNSSSEADFRSATLEFLSHIERMFSLMSSLLNFPDTALFEDERSTIALQLINYLESSGHVRKEMYTRYVQYLVDLHCGLKNCVEAGYSQLQQLRMLDWSEEILSKFNNYSEEPERTRKEQMYFNAIKLFEEGEDWESAIAAMEELREYYQNYNYDYHKLATLLINQAECYRSVVQGERFYSNYFRVCFYGEFEPSIKDKEFVYRGVKLEPIMDFTNRIKKKFPAAKIFMSSDKPNPEAFKETKQIISITTLTKCSDSEKKEVAAVLDKLPPTTMELLNQKYGAGGKVKQTNNKFTPPAVLKHRENTELRVFSYAKAIQKSAEKKPINEFKELWVSKNYVFVEDQFPTNRRRLQIIDRKEILLSPIENALSTIVNKNQELKEKMDQVQNAPPGPVDVGPLSMNLNGMIDAAVNGGTQKYIEAFLGPESNKQDPAISKYQLELKNALKQQSLLLKQGLDVFGKRCDAKLKGLFEHLSGFYDDMVKKLTPIFQ